MPGAQTVPMLDAAALLFGPVRPRPLVFRQRYILIRLFRRPDLPKLFGGTTFTTRTLRLVWHLLTIAWLGFAALLWLAQQGLLTPAVVLQTVALMAATSALLPLLFTRGRHLAWVVLAVIAGLVWLRVRSRQIDIDARRESDMALRANERSRTWFIVGLSVFLTACQGSGSDARISHSDATPGPTSFNATPASPTGNMYVATSALNQRSSPDGPVVAKASGGESLAIYERREGWARVSPEGAAPRWVASRLLCSGSGCYSPPPPKQWKKRDAPSARSQYDNHDCPCSGNRVCIGPRGGRYCITSGGNKRYGV